MAQQEADAARYKLGSINPKDEDGIVALQRVVQCAEWFEIWLNELISKGDDAINAFKQQQES